MRRLSPLFLLPILLGASSCGGGSSVGTAASGSGNPTGANLPTQQEVNEAPVPLSFVSGPPPAAADLSTSPALPPVMNQSLKDCIAFAFGYELATFEVATSSNISADQLSHQASPADLYAKLLAKEQEGCDSGTSASDALDILVRQGVQSLALAPYRDGQCVVPSTSGAFGIQGYHTIKPTDKESIKLTLASGHPVGMAVSLYDNMSAWGQSHHDDSVFSGMGIPSSINGHGMLIVGYDDSRKAWKVMNSWGSTWGNRGFFWMGYDTFDASARVAYAVDGGGTSVGTDPGTPVIFLKLQALDYTSLSSPTHYLVMPFQFDHAAQVMQARMISGPTGAATPWQKVNRWLSRSYLWWGLGSAWPQGNYTLELQCQTTTGKPYTLSQKSPLSPGGQTRAYAQTFASADKFPLKGAKIVANGNLVGLF